MADLITLECVRCGKPFIAYAAQDFCSDTCSKTDAEYAREWFWSRVDIRGPDECWPWIAGLDSNGYGYFEERKNGKRKHIIAHRRAYELGVGPIPPGEGYYGTVIRHTCDTPACQNPAHLTPGTQKQNMRDMAVRERGSATKITASDAIAIRSDDRPYLDIAAQYGIKISSVCDIKKRRTWKHV